MLFKDVKIGQQVYLREPRRGPVVKVMQREGRLAGGGLVFRPELRDLYFVDDRIEVEPVPEPRTYVAVNRDSDNDFTIVDTVIYAVDLATAMRILLDSMPEEQRAAPGKALAPFRFLALDELRVLKEKP